MGEKVATRNIRLKNEHNGIFNNAVVAIFESSEVSQVTRKTETGIGEYIIDHDITGISYTAMYKYAPDQMGMDWVQYKAKDADGNIVKAHTVDLGNPQVVAALQGVADTGERVARAIYADISSKAV